jgi:hypothetical protein
MPDEKTTPATAQDFLDALFTAWKREDAPLLFLLIAAVAVTIAGLEARIHDLEKRVAGHCPCKGREGG